MRIVVFGLSLSSSWGNGHATTWRALLPGLARCGCDVLFLERDVPWYASHRDLTSCDGCRLSLYSQISELNAHLGDVRCADAVIVSSFVPDGIEIGERVCQEARGLRLFYDIDTPVTLEAVDAGTCTYIAPYQFGSYDGYLSFTGGPTLERLEREYGASNPRALYCSVDTRSYRPLPVSKRWDLGFMGTYSHDRQADLEKLLLEPARKLADRKFVVVGAQYPRSVPWPANVDHIEHLAPEHHPEFYSSLDWTLNLTRSAMKHVGFSPSVRLFEAAACGTPIVSDDWTGLETALTPGCEIAVAQTTDDVLSILQMQARDRRAIAEKARSRTLTFHSGDHRAAELVAYIEEMAGSQQRAANFGMTV